MNVDSTILCKSCGKSIVIFRDKSIQTKLVKEDYQ